MLFCTSGNMKLETTSQYCKYYQYAKFEFVLKKQVFLKHIIPITKVAQTYYCIQVDNTCLLQSVLPIMIPYLTIFKLDGAVAETLKINYNKTQANTFST